MYRQFYLVNGLGEKYTLSDQKNKSFLHSPTGLGASKSVDLVRYGDSEKLNSSLYNMPEVGGEILFYAERERAYQDYYEFMQFLSHEPLKLYQITPNSLDPYFIDCEFISIEKTEYSSEDSCLHCAVQLHGKTFWQNSTEKMYTFSSAFTGGGKNYPYSYPYFYSGNTLSSMDIDVNGTMPSGFKMEIDGLVTNPQITAYDSAGKEYGVAKFVGTFRYLRLNTDDDAEEIYLEDSDGNILNNPTSYQDPDPSPTENSVVTFFKFKPGRTNLVFNCGNMQSFDGELIFTYKNKMASV